MYFPCPLEQAHEDTGGRKSGLYREDLDLDHKRNESVGLTVRALICSLCQASLFRLQSKLICQIIDRLDLCELRIFKDVSIEGGIGEPPALDRRFEAVAISFHRECHDCTRL